MVSSGSRYIVVFVQCVRVVQLNCVKVHGTGNKSIVHKFLHGSKYSLGFQTLVKKWVARMI